MLPVAAWALALFWNIYSAEHHKMAKNLKTTEAREKFSSDWESLEFYKIFMHVLLKFKTIELYLIKLAINF